jgi:hypothetical protein
MRAMATSGKQRRGLDLPGKGPAQQDQQQEQLPDFDQVMEGSEMSAEVAGQLQPQMGNEAILALLARTASTEQAAQGGGEQEEEELVEVDEELEDLELEVKAVGGTGGSGAPSTPSDADPWDVGLLFGGEDDPDDPRTTRAGPRMASPATAASAGSPEQWKDNDDSLPSDAFDRVDAALGTTPPRGEDRRSGDATLRAVEAGLQRPSTIGRRGLKPESLIDRTDHLDPIGRPAAIGRFMCASAGRFQSRALARVLSGPASVLVPEATGHSGAAARMAALAVCVEAFEGGGAETDRSVALSLCRDAWPDAVIAARHIAQTQRLVAPAILAHIRGPEAPIPEERAHSASSTRTRALASTHLGNCALETVIPHGFIPTIPPLTSPQAPPSPTLGPDLAAADAALERFITGRDATDLPPEPILDWEMTQPILNAATALINAMGRAQVEFSAAALAVSRVRPSGGLEQTLRYADRALRELARSVVSDGDRLHKAIGTPLMGIGELPSTVQHSIGQSADALHGLRIWAFSTLVQEMNR